MRRPKNSMTLLSAKKYRLKNIIIESGSCMIIVIVLAFGEHIGNIPSVAFPLPLS